MLSERYQIGTAQLEYKNRKLHERFAAITAAIKSLSKHKVSPFLEIIARGLSTFDWRTSAAPGLTEMERQRQLVFRGSSGYKEIRGLLLKHLADLENEVGVVAAQLRETA